MGADEAVSIREEVLGPEHPDTKAAQTMAASVQRCIENLQVEARR